MIERNIMKTGKCAICPTVGKLYKDRYAGGLLCSDCHNLIEYVKGDVEILRNMANFLEKWERVGPVEDNCWKPRVSSVA